MSSVEAIDHVRLRSMDTLLLGMLAWASRPFRRSRIFAQLEKVAENHFVAVHALTDGALVALSFLCAYLIRFSNRLGPAEAAQFLLCWPILVLARVLVNRAMRVYCSVWRFVCLGDAIAIARALLVVTGVMVGLRLFYPPTAAFAHTIRVPLGVIVLEYFFSLSACLGMRTCSRMIREWEHRTCLIPGQRRRRVVLYGAGQAGVVLARELVAEGLMEIVGFVDDDPHKAGTVVAGIPVLGTGAALEAIVGQQLLDGVVISIAAVNTKDLARILQQCKKIPVNTEIVPSLEEIVTQRVKITRVREVRIEDLLGRNSVTVDEFSPNVRQVYQGKRVLVTGAGGSIGSELTRQLLLLDPAQISILDKDENSIFELEQEMKIRGSKIPIEPLMADIRDPQRLAAVFAETKPEVVLHAAAHKHVPLMERHPCEAVLNNVLGTRNVLEACRAYGVRRLAFISSDKAVNPTNVMGATKRVGERLVAAYARDGALQGACVRFGNVMGSRGSVIPLFRRQIDQGGPVTVTHPDIVRYFMTIPEAVQLVLSAGSLANGGEVFVLDMGSPRKILDLARQMIELSGLEPGKDIEISITGLRPGEKMNEELAAQDEPLRATCFEKISVIEHAPFDEEAFRERVASLIAAARANERRAVYETLAAMGLGFHPSGPPLGRDTIAPNLSCSAA